MLPLRSRSRLPYIRQQKRSNVEVAKVLSSITENLFAWLHWTPLHASAIPGYAQVVAHLLDTGVDRDAQDEVEITALAYSVDGGFRCTEFTSENVPGINMQSTDEKLHTQLTPSYCQGPMAD